MRFFKFFIPFFWMVGGFILIHNGIMIIDSIDDWTKYLLGICVLFMAFGIIGKAFQDIEDTSKKEVKNE